MRILIFHPVLLPPKDYGGVERVVLWLAQGLREQGHQVAVAALAGSRLPPGCDLVPVEKKYYSAEALAKLCPPHTDLVHFMAPIGNDLWEQLPFPALLTVHGNGQPGESYPINTVFLSRNHAERHGAIYFIYNGIDPAECIFNPTPRTFTTNPDYLFLSKTNWRVKNLTGAMSYCRQAKVGLKIAGGRRPFTKRLTSALTPRMQWVGPVAGARKAQLLAAAQALVFPVIWPEPFGLVVAEALMSGTPVLAAARGSLPEMIPADVGAVLKTDVDWVAQLRKGSQDWDPARCRAWAAEKFHYLIMAENYVRAYQAVVAGNKLHAQNPQRISDK